MTRLLFLSFLWVSFAPAQDGFKPLFNGKDLTGWDGNPELWSVEDGCITGKTTGPEQLSYNQFLVWRGGVLKNFELRVKVKQAGNNTGIQYRSREFPETGKWSVGGYQCDIHPSAPNNAMVYGEKWGGILAQNGQSVVIDPEGSKWLTGTHEPVKVDIAEWHEYTILAQGNHLVHKIDGQETIDLLDFGAKTELLEGILAFQIHRGPAMKVQIKDVMLKELPEGGVVSFDQRMIANAKPVEAKGKGKAQPKAEAVTPVANAAVTAEWKWLWSDSPASKSAARLKKEFDLGDAEIKSAVLRVSCDNGAQVFLNGELVLTNPDWQRPTQADVAKALKRGKNELRAEATNKSGAAGFLAVLSVTLADGTERNVFTDASWSAAAPKTEEWKAAKVVNTYGKKPYGEIFSKDRAKNPSASSDEVIAPADIKALPGFKV
ncbi:MAG: Cytochrome c, partial [Prosthecobacter sp.]|nr:Cytochrome c [Prosthecobacter sp.]